MKAIRIGNVSVPIRAHVMVATPCYSGSVAHECAQAMQLATMHCLTQGVVLDWQIAAGFSLVQAGRNWLNAQFLRDKQYTHVLWLDDDLFFAPDAVMKLIERRLNAVGGCYSTKHPVKPIFPYQASGPVVDGLQPVTKLPGGFLLLARVAVEAANAGLERYEMEHDSKTESVPNLFDPHILGDDYDVIVRDNRLHGEDFVYCERLVKAGVAVYVETDIDFGHIGRNIWKANLAQVLAKEAEAGVEGEASPERWKAHEEAPQALAN